MNLEGLFWISNGGGRLHITFNRGGVLFGHYFANKGAELEIRSTFVEFESKWYYFVATQDKKKAIMYIDGKVDGEAVSGSDVRFDYIEFGLSIAENSGGGTFFNGAMDEVKIWSVAFTADEVQESMSYWSSGKAHHQMGSNEVSRQITYSKPAPHIFVYSVFKLKLKYKGI